MQSGLQHRWTCGVCASRTGAAVLLPSEGAVCACGASPSYRDVLAAMKQRGADETRASFHLRKGTAKGEWWRSTDLQQRPSAMLRCPECGRPAFLEGDSISGAGTVDPEFACDGAGCSFVARLTLDGWTAGHSSSS